MSPLASLLLLQSIASVAQAPVLEFPEAGLDDPAAYEGYATRFYRDAGANAFQIYLNARDGRVVHVWADASNASAAFTARDAAGEPAAWTWGDTGAEMGLDGSTRTMAYRLASQGGPVEVSRFLLGTMRQERDVPYLDWFDRPFGEPFAMAELTGLVSSLERLPPDERSRHLGLLNARDLTELRGRLHPGITFDRGDDGWSLLAEHTTLDGRNHMTLELRGDGATTASFDSGVLSLEAAPGRGVEVEVTVSTDHQALKPFDRDEIFNDAFEAYYAGLERVADSLRRGQSQAERERSPELSAFRRFDRQVRALALLSSEDKLQASMPNYATYFGRDMMMTALMLEPVVSVDVQEQVIASVLGKLGPDGDVSHEEALGGQAIREAAVEYSAAVAEQRLDHARRILQDLQAVRENYHMIDDDFQLPVLAARYLTRWDVSSERKRRFLRATVPNGATRLDALMRNLALVADLARPYADDPVATNLVGFTRPDPNGGWYPGSWRDSRAGYGNGRFAMDVNVVWVPKGLEALRAILEAVDRVGMSAEESAAGLDRDTSELATLMSDSAALDNTIEAWRGARRHFEVTLDADAIGARVRRLLERAGEAERGYWRQRFEADAAVSEPLSFLAVALDEQGRPIPAVSTDPATDLFLTDYTEQILDGRLDPEVVESTLDAFVRPYPAGLFVEGLGPVVVNDAYASADVQQAFRDDPYHSPYVVWGREVNLLVLGLAHQIGAAYDQDGRPREDTPAMRSYVNALRRALAMTQESVEASGLRHNELWSYRIEDGVLYPTRYGTSSDIQLWNVTDLAVRFLVDRLPQS